jgi:hypothetical protein
MRMRILALLALGLGLVLGAAPASAQNRFNLINNTSETIERAYVSPSRVNDWGRDVLGNEVLRPGERYWVVPRLSDCLLDIKVVFVGGREETRWQINTCNLTNIVWGGAPAAAGDPSFRFINRTGATIRELYVSLSSDNSWGRDRLGSDMLGPNAGFNIGLPPGKVCTVDIRVVFTDGQATERRGVETCSIRDLNFR